MDSYWNLPSRSHYSSSPKVVSIPVRFVGTERSRSDSAVKIQKVFRGFLVRKSVKKILAISRDVEEIEKRISKEESVELIRRDSRERLKVNETLMSLLFRLDSVKGVDSGVRDCRKKVIKKAIALQEMVDAIAVADHNAEIVAENELKEENVEDTVEVKQVIVESDNGTPFLSECGGESVGTKKSESLIEEGEENNSSGKDKRYRELLQRMVEDNERLMGLMEGLVEKNQMQTQLLSSLSQRVEQLERAFVCDRLRRKKLFTGRDCL